MSHLVDVLLFGPVFAAIVHLRAQYGPFRLYSAGAFGAKIRLVSQGHAPGIGPVLQYVRLLVQEALSTRHDVVTTIRTRWTRPTTSTAGAPSRIGRRSQAQADTTKPPSTTPAAAQYDTPPASPAPLSPHRHRNTQKHKLNHAAAHEPVAPPLPRRHPDAHNPVLAAMRYLEQAYAILAEHANRLYGLARIRAMENIAVATRAKQLLEGPAAGQGKGGSGSGGGEGTGVGTGKGSGSGPGEGTGTVRERRRARWRLLFDTASSEDYVNQLIGLGAFLAVEQGNGEHLIYRDLAHRPVRGKVEDIWALDRQRWFPDDPHTTARLARVLGIQPVPTRIILLFPADLEKELLEKEINAFNRKESEIGETVFRFVRRGNRYEPVVIRQTEHEGDR